MENSILAATFNLRCDTPADGGNSFQHRKGFILDKLAAEAPDVVGFQELTPPMREWLERYLPQYHFAGHGRGADYQDEANCVAYRKETLELLALDCFWLSPTPTVPGSRYEGQSPCPRICVCTVLKHKKSRRPFRFYNTHLDHEGEEAQAKGLRQILARIAADQTQSPLPVVLTGDFNFTPQSPNGGIVAACAQPRLIDLAAKIPGTYHEFGRIAPMKIDYLYVDESLSARAEPARAWEDVHDGVTLSDHYPLCARLWV